MKGIFFTFSVTFGCRGGMLDGILRSQPATTEPGSCPTETFYCPDGEEIELENFSIWNDELEKCEFNEDLDKILDRNCKLYVCGREYKDVQQYHRLRVSRRNCGQKKLNFCQKFLHKIEMNFLSEIIF